MRNHYGRSASRIYFTFPMRLSFRPCYRGNWRVYLSAVFFEYTTQCPFASFIIVSVLRFFCRNVKRSSFQWENCIQSESHKLSIFRISVIGYIERYSALPDKNSRRFE